MRAGMELLAAAEREAQGQPLPVERIVECMMRPSVEAGLEHPAFNKMVARTLLAPPKFLHSAPEGGIRAESEGVHRGAGARAARGADRVLNLRLALALGATLMFGVQMSAIKIKRDAQREAAFLKELVRFTASGLASRPATQGAELARLRPPAQRKEDGMIRNVKSGLPRGSGVPGGLHDDSALPAARAAGAGSISRSAAAARPVRARGRGGYCGARDIPR